MFPAVLYPNRGKITQGVAIQHVDDANERLSLLGISVGTHIIQDDGPTEYIYNGDAEAVLVAGAGTEAANGYYTKRGTSNGKGYFTLLGMPSHQVEGGVSWDGSIWVIYNAAGQLQYQSTDDVAYPWLVTTWTLVNGANPVPTTAHIASKNALLTCAFVSLAGTAAANGIYTERPGQGELVTGRKVYNLLGQVDDFHAYSIYPGAVTKWRITDSGGTILYTSTDNVQYPWQVTTWVAVAVPLEDLPVVVSKNQGQADAGCLVTGAGTGDANQSFKNNGAGTKTKYDYIGLFNSGIDLKWNPSWQTNGGDPSSSDDTAFPFEATFNDAAVITRNDIASESSWEPLPA